MKLTRRTVASGLAAALASGSGGRLWADIRRSHVGPETDVIATVGFRRPGVGAAVYRRQAGGSESPGWARSADGAWWRVANAEVTPEQLGALPEDHAHDAAFSAACALGLPLRLLSGQTYRLAHTAPLSAPVSGGGIIAAIPGFTDPALVRLERGATLQGPVLDGANLPRPAGPWLGVGVPRGCAIVAEARPGEVPAKVAITDVTVRDCPSGAVFLRGLQGFEVRRLTASHVQTERTLITSAAVELYDCRDGELSDCTLQDYGWKGFALDACRRVTVTNGRAVGGRPGHAAHYMDDSEDCGFLGCRHAGRGYGAKATRSLRPIIRDYTAEGSAGAVQFQSCRDFLAEDIASSDTATAAVVVASGLEGPSTGGLLRRVRASWKEAAGHPNRVGLALESNGTPAAQILGLKIADWTVERPFIGVHGLSQPGATVDIDIDGLTVTDPVQYAVIVFVRSLHLNAVTLRGGAWSPGVAIYSAPGGAAGDVVLSGVDVAGGRAGSAMVEVGVEPGRSARFRSLSVTACVSHGPGALLSARLPSDTLRVTVSSNRIQGVATGAAAELELGAARLAQVEIVDNIASDREGRDAVMVVHGPMGRQRISGNRARMVVGDR